MQKNTIPENILLAQENLYNPYLNLENITKEQESSEYQAHRFSLNNHSVIFRQAKITPTKTGQFVTCWKRSDSKETAPFDTSDDIDFLIVGVNYNQRAGQFIFPKKVLIEQKIVSVNNLDGKRGIRVYPAWDKPDNKQAEKTQLWQLQYFFDITSKNIDTSKIKNLFKL